MQTVQSEKQQNEEPVLFKKAANLFRGIESVGGWLHASETRMKFVPHALNIQSAPLDIPYADIASIAKRNTMGIVPNGILLTLKSGARHKFVLYKRSSFIAFVNGKISGVL
ncbi:hypothetical protein ACFPPD_02355 [Cohnella suwonensis]|uniref:GRAM domain-containing protein n=1 Tax=Cohnella suwonensis TaxID=696072 RepID=A0ABW0LS79_9BACL